MKRIGLLCGVLALALSTGYAQSSEGWTKYEVDKSGTAAVRTMAVDNSNRVYVVWQEGNGLSSLVQGTLVFDLLQKSVQTLAVDAKGDVWGCVDGSLWKRVQGNWQKIDNEKFGAVHAMAAGSNNVVWFALDPVESEAHLVGWDGDTWSGMQLPIGMDKVTALAVGKNNAVWVGTPSSGVFLIAEGKVQPIVDANFILPSLHVRDIQIAANGDVWVATDGGIGWYDGTKWKVFQSMNSNLPEDTVAALAIDQKNTVWTLTKPLAYYREGVWRTVPWSASMTGQYSAMVIDRNNTVWVAGHGGSVFSYRGTATDVTERVDSKKQSYTRAYPNPFTDRFSIVLDLPQANHVDVTIVDMLGNTLATLANGVLPAGQQTIHWDGTTNTGQQLYNGVYYCWVVAQEYTTCIPVQRIGL